MEHKEPLKDEDASLANNTLLISKVIDNLVTMTELGVILWSTPDTPSNFQMAVRCSKTVSNFQTVISHINTRIGVFEINLYITRKVYKLTIISPTSGRNVNLVKLGGRFARICKAASNPDSFPHLNNHYYLLSQTEDILKRILGHPQ